MNYEPILIALLINLPTGLWIVYTFFRKNRAEKDAIQLTDSNQFRADIMTELKELRQQVKALQKADVGHIKRETELVLENERFKDKIQELKEEIKEFKFDYNQIILERVEEQKEVERMRGEIRKLKEILERNNIRLEQDV